MKLRYHTQILSSSLSKQATEAANNRMNTPYYTGGNPMAALNSFNAGMGPVMRLLSEAREAEAKAASAKQSFFEATKLLITATQKAKSITSQDNLLNLPLLEKIYSPVATANPTEFMVEAGKMFIKANEACIAILKKNGRADDEYCSVNRMAAFRKYKESKLNVTNESPATRTIESNVNRSQDEMFDEFQIAIKRTQSKGPGSN
jgi:hypothetical protein